MGALALMLGGCPDHPGPAATGAKVTKKPAGMESTLSTLSLSQSVITARLGAHTVSCDATLEASATGGTPQKVVQQVTLSVDARGNFAAKKDTAAQHGQEVIWTGGWLYPRQRHGKFIRRRARSGEPKQIADRVAGHLPSYLELLAPYMVLEPGGETTHEQRKALRVSLKLAPTPGKVPTATATSRRWRQTIKVQSLTGLALLDVKTHVPLSVDLTAAWTFAPPAGKTPPSGIPTKLAPKGHFGTMKLKLRQRVTRVGAVPAVQPPPANQVMDVRRVRLERERQMFSGEVPIPGQGRAP